jgi:HK97 family phage major capsid protein
MRRLKLTSGVREFAGLKELREFRGEIAETIQTLAAAFDSRKAKRDMGDEVPLWEGDEEARFTAAGDDLKTVDAAIAEENRSLEIAAARAAAGTLPPDRSPLRDSTPGDRAVIVPARALALAGRMKAFTNDEDGRREAYTAGQYALMLAGNEQARAWCRDHLPEECRAMTAANFGTGGALVPTGMSANVIRLVEQYGVAAADCEIVPMATETLNWPRRSSGVTLYAVGENGSITESTPGFDGIGLTARKWAALVKYPTELEESAVINIGDFLTQEMAWAWAKKLDEAVFLGDGTSTYHGIKGIKNALADGSEVTALAGNTAFSTLDLVDFESMTGKLATWAEVSGRAKWYISKPGWAASMSRLADAAGGNTAANIADGASRTSFLGYPVRWVPVMNSTLTAQGSAEGLAYLGDLMGGVVIGMRRDIRMAVARERYIEYDQIGFFMTVRFDVNVHDIGDSSNPGGIIGLEAPGS